ncbi:MAG: NAD(P)/FAD-dependent oxidoreductase [candidate division Zixibacteria bacterium]|nr:NAD(P)/FAD-dependent oxidoreductase [candidate division Zixibacteria bacterium]
MDRRFDIVVIGAGPAGCLAALTAARAGCRTLLVEKHKTIGEPLCCAEGISFCGLNDNIPLDHSWIDADVERCYLRSPAGHELQFDHPDAGFVLSRRRFEQGMADLAVQAGCELATGTETVGLLNGSGERFHGVRLLDGQTTYDVGCQIIIAADGIESMVARWAGIDTTLPVEHLDSAAQFLFDGVPDLDPTRMEFYFDTQLAPGGYAWVFPKGNGIANVGIAVAPVVAQGRKAMPMLREFMRFRFGQRSPKPLKRTVGGIPEFCGRKFMLSRNVMVTGDAARLLDSITGAGIANALSSGRIAAETAVLYLQGGRGDLRVLKSYPERWMALRGREMLYFLWARQIFLRLTNADFDAMVAAMAQVYNGQTLTAIDPIDVIKRALRTRPSLLRLARHLVW